MKAGFIVNSNRMAPCFAGNELFVYDDSVDSSEHEVIDTTSWELRDWVTALLKRDVDQLLCSSIDQFLYGALLGNGIVVIPNVIGAIDEVKDKWQKGMIPNEQGYGFRRRHCGHGKKHCRNNG